MIVIITIMAIWADIFINKNYDVIGQLATKNSHYNDNEKKNRDCM